MWLCVSGVDYVKHNRRNKNCQFIYSPELHIPSLKPELLSCFSDPLPRYPAGIFAFKCSRAEEIFNLLQDLMQCNSINTVEEPVVITRDSHPTEREHSQTPQAPTSKSPSAHVAIPAAAHTKLPFAGHRYFPNAALLLTCIFMPV